MNLRQYMENLMNIGPRCMDVYRKQNGGNTDRKKSFYALYSSRFNCWTAVRFKLNSDYIQTETYNLVRVQFYCL